MERRGRSIASVLNVLLLILAYALAITLLVVGGVGLLGLIEPNYIYRLVEEGLIESGVERSAIPINFVLGFCSILAVLLLTLRLRDVLRTVAKGEPFHPDNPRRLRLVALFLAAVSAINLAADILVKTNPDERADFDLTAWISVLIVFVLAEVFREGARLRAEAELTV